MTFINNKDSIKEILNKMKDISMIEIMKENEKYKDSLFYFDKKFLKETILFLNSLLQTKPIEDSITFLKRQLNLSKILLKKNLEKIKSEKFEEEEMDVFHFLSFLHLYNEFLENLISHLEKLKGGEKND